MIIIQGLTDQPNQQTTIVLDDGSRVVLTMEFRAQQTGWFFSLAWPGLGGVPFELNGQRLVASPNLLRQFRRLLPFGLGLITVANMEPTGQQAFTDGSTALLLLDETDLANIEAGVFVGL